MMTSESKTTRLSIFMMFWYDSIITFTSRNGIASFFSDDDDAPVAFEVPVSEAASEGLVRGLIVAMHLR